MMEKKGVSAGHPEMMVKPLKHATHSIYRHKRFKVINKPCNI